MLSFIFNITLNYLLITTSDISKQKMSTRRLNSTAIVVGQQRSYRMLYSAKTEHETNTNNFGAKFHK
jgi:hypothetical protein